MNVFQRTLCQMVRDMHCRSTHHLFAIDALNLVQTPAGNRLVGILLRHYSAYLKGAIDPDTRIRDFHNQILHAEDGYWGGAPRVAHQWYNRLQNHLRDGNYPLAAQAAGLLSHYFTDPIQPLHTASSDREALVHRPLERSIYVCYEQILQRWREDEMRVVFQLSSDSKWLESAMLRSAQFAYRRFSVLVNSYHFDKGVESPAEGFDDVSITVLSELIGLAITGWARVIERAARDAESLTGNSLPAFSTAWPIARSSLTIPVSYWGRRCRRLIDDFEIHSMADEYRTKGRLEKWLPDEVDIKRRVNQIYHDEKRYRAENERRRLEKLERKLHRERDRFDVVAPATVTQGTPKESPARELSSPRTKPTPHLINALSPTDPVNLSPSITKQLAARLCDAGIKTVGALLTCDPEQIAAGLNVYWIDDVLIRNWQVQASLMCFIPGIQTVDAQLLAACGFQSARQIANSDPKHIYSELQQFSVTTAGRSYLKGAECPSPERVARWINEAAGILNDRRAG